MTEILKHCSPKHQQTKKRGKKLKFNCTQNIFLKTLASASKMSCYVLDFWRIFLSVIQYSKKFKRYVRDRP
jgi:hypothetical protein